MRPGVKSRMTTCWTLEEVAAWGPRWQTLGRNEDFLRPHAEIWPGEKALIPGLIGGIQESLDGTDRRRFNQAVLAALSLSPCRRELLSLLDGCLDPADSGLPLTLEELAAIEWICIPTVLADDRRGVLRFILLGHGGDAGKSLQIQQMDKAATEAAKLALGLAGMPEAVVWPILETDILGPALHGDSLALPVALGAWSLRRGGSWPEGLVCTGALSEDGRVTPVDNVLVKARTAANMGFKLLLHPLKSFEQSSTAWPEKLINVEVQTLDEAKALLACYDPGHAPEMARLFRQRHKQAKVVGMLPAVPAAFLEYLDSVEPDFLSGLREYCSHPQHAGLLLAKLEESIKVRTPPLAEVSRLLDILFPFETWFKRAVRYPDAGLSVARLHIEAANHQGLIHESTRWEPVLSQACSGLCELQDSRSEEILAAIHALVGKMHNRFAFSAWDLEEQVRHLEGIIGELQREWMDRRQRSPNACCDILGRFHGTLAQHYGFCGPAYLAEVERHVRLSQDAFGNGMVEQYLADWRRGFSYLFHALLDAGRLETTQEALEAYLDRRLATLEFSDLNPFEHYHLAKFMALAGGNVPGYLEWSMKYLPDANPEHPRQLWALNLGKAAMNLEDKGRFLRASLRLCRAASGPTIRAMALMPLAWLAQAALMDQKEAAQGVEDVVEEIRTSGLDQGHFMALFHKPGSEVLEYVLAKEARLFPFGYR